jgi:hypothetical protein
MPVRDGMNAGPPDRARRYALDRDEIRVLKTLGDSGLWTESIKAQLFQWVHDTMLEYFASAGDEDVITAQASRLVTIVRHHLESFAEAEQTYADAGRRESPPESEENIVEAQRSVSTVMRLLRRPLGRLADDDQV